MKDDPRKRDRRPRARRAAAGLWLANRSGPVDLVPARPLEGDVDLVAVAVRDDVELAVADVHQPAAVDHADVDRVLIARVDVLLLVDQRERDRAVTVGPDRLLHDGR